MSSSEVKDPKPTAVHLEYIAASPAPARGARFADPDGGDAPPLAPSTTVDTEKGTNSAYANSESGLQLRDERARAERKLLWKFGKWRTPQRGGGAGVAVVGPDWRCT